MPDATFAERVALRTRGVTIGGLALLSALAWLYLLSGAGMPAMLDMTAMVVGWPTIATMWAVMMIAMMLPSAAPVILLYGKVQRTSAGGNVGALTLAFLAGYLACWTAFAALAALLQLELQCGALASSMSMALTSKQAAAGLLIAAGVYQLTPLKDACLGRCRSSAQFLSRHYRPGAAGAVRLGLLHGAHCVGCCWLLMALLFVGGVMNLLWIAGLTLLVAAEKLLAKGRALARIAGAAMIAWGAAILLL